MYEKIRYLHEQEGLSQKAIATQMNISGNTVKKYYDADHVPWQNQGYGGKTCSVADVKAFGPYCSKLQIYGWLWNKKQYL